MNTDLVEIAIANDTNNGNRFQFNSESIHSLHLTNVLIKQSTTPVVQSAAKLSVNSNHSLSFERRVDCNLQTPDNCHTTNKSLIITFWGQKSSQHWLVSNLLSAFPDRYFDYIVMIHDNSSWNHYPAYDKIIWIHVKRQLRFWYLKRFISPHTLRAYRYVWILDDDIRLDFNTRVYECVADKFKILLSSPARGQGRTIYKVTRKVSNYTSRIGRWTDFVETGPIFVAQTLAATCIWNYIDEKVGLGYGLDLVWCRVLSTQCFQQRSISKICAILDAFVAHHESTRITTLQIGLDEMPAYSKYYKKYSSKKLLFGPVASDSSALNQCKAKVSITS
jgi:hypothetical protein